jgi:hypothetical protein
VSRNICDVLLNLSTKKERALADAMTVDKKEHDESLSHRLTFAGPNDQIADVMLRHLQQGFVMEARSHEAQCIIVARSERPLL